MSIKALATALFTRRPPEPLTRATLERDLEKGLRYDNSALYGDALIQTRRNQTLDDARIGLLTKLTKGFSYSTAPGYYRQFVNVLDRKCPIPASNAAVLQSLIPGFSYTTGSAYQGAFDTVLNAGELGKPQADLLRHLTKGLSYSSFSNYVVAFGLAADHPELTEAQAQHLKKLADGFSWSPRHQYLTQFRDVIDTLPTPPS